jgi:hypothetical protein
MALAPNSETATLPTLNIATDKVAFIIVKAREFDVKEADSDPDSGSNAADDGETDVLEDKPDDPVHEELVSLIHDLNVDEKAELVALAWLGRGTFEISDWNEAISTAKSEHGKRAAQYLLGLPMLGDYLEEGLAAFGKSISDEAESA